MLKEILKVDKTLKKMYRIIKEFYKMFESKTVKTMRRRIEQLIEKLRVFNIKQSIKLADTITSWKKEIINIVEYKINNGFVEGNNNKIKVIKRVSYGLRNYERFRKLIYLRLCNR
nr:transposase [Campylobacter concisus]